MVKANELIPSHNQLVSIHGGHSGEFCNHAADSLEETVLAYIAQGFAWVGITEHMPPVSDDFLYSEEIEAGLNAAVMYERFARYMTTARELQAKYARDIRIFVAFEGESYTGAIPFMQRLIAEFEPDYVVGSVHHVDDRPFDLGREGYWAAAARAGGIDALYGRYFDQQYEMLEGIRPLTVGHFDYIRIYDPDYTARLQKPAIWRKVMRNLQYIKEHNLILDYNVAALRKGQPEPYVCRPILQAAIRLGIPLIPGDDSHGVQQVGAHIVEGIHVLEGATPSPCGDKK